MISIVISSRRSCISFDPGDVDLSLYELRKKRDKELKLKEGEGELSVPGGKSGSRKDELVKLSSVIETFNQRFGTEYKVDVGDEGESMLDELETRINPLVQAGNDTESLQVEFNGMLMDVVTERYEEFSRFIDDVFSDETMSQAFQELMFEGVMSKIKQTQAVEDFARA